MASNTVKFKNIEHYGDPTLIEELEVNLKHWFDWAFLSIGAWTDIDSDASGIHGGAFNKLNNLEDGNYAYNQVYFGIRKDWAYETGVDYKSPTQTLEYLTYDESYDKVKVGLGEYEYSYYNSGDAVTISTDLINKTLSATVFSGIDNKSFLLNENLFDIKTQSEVEIQSQAGLDLVINGSGTTGSIFGTYNPTTPKIYVDSVLTGSGYTVDYPRGRVIFDEGIPASSSVTADYSYRNVQVYAGNDASFPYEVQYDSQNPANNSWEASAESGNFSSDPSQRIQLPAVLVEAVAKKTSKGYQLGSSLLKMHQDVLVTVVSENRYERNIITDILSKQKNKSINLYDIDVLTKKNKNSLNFDGSRNSVGLMYNDIHNDNSLYWSTAYIHDAYVSEVETNNPNLYMSKIRFKIEVIK